MSDKKQKLPTICLPRVFGVVRVLILLVFYLVFTPSFWCGPSTHLVSFLSRVYPVCLMWSTHLISFLSRVFGVVRVLIWLVFYLVFTPSFWCGVLILLVFYLVFTPSFWCGVLILLVFYLVFLVWSEYSSY